MILRKFIRSPLFHFFVIGAAIFVAFSVFNDSPPAQQDDEITLTPQVAEQLKNQFAATWKRPPTQSEMDSLFRAWLLEEAYVREALRLGLDRGDQVIRQRLSMKMQFIAESGASTLEADDATLQAFLDANPDRFRQQAQYSFDQVLLPAGESAERIAEIQAELQSGADPASVGRTSLLPPSVPMAPASTIDSVFGTGFNTALADLPLDRWQGPVESAYGQHLVRLNARAEASLPELSDIRQKVEAEWRAARSQELRDAFGEALLARYQVNLPADVQEQSQ